MPRNLRDENEDPASIEAKLSILGLRGLQATTFLSLLRNGPSTASQTAIRIRVNRTDVYRVIKDLVGRNLVNTTMQNPNIYEAADSEDGGEDSLVRTRRSGKVCRGSSS